MLLRVLLQLRLMLVYLDATDYMRESGRVLGWGSVGGMRPHVRAT